MERWKTLEVAALWSETKNTWPSIFGSFDLIIVPRERAENDNFFRVRTQVRTWYFTPKSQHLSTHVRIYKLIYYERYTIFKMFCSNLGRVFPPNKRTLPLVQSLNDEPGHWRVSFLREGNWGRLERGIGDRWWVIFISYMGRAHQ